ncbi:HAD family hydrolase [Olsenella profusa]|uniref:HAD family hydrolase n=1 Tax=Olsenella profusa TaxID=138595 RepID=A0ABS2F155_9ACTN|nr:Cof-type HAD-IIB family hydrolase [Olsenella profusa]MBM6774323.1 HAD family hydrolase [Olsenella profusa]
MTRLVFVDLDGTFLLPDKTVSAENLAILDEAAARGVQVVPCTGRNVTGVPRELAEHPCVRYAVCCNGALVCDVRTNEVLREVDMERELVRSLYDDLRDLDITFDLFADGTVYTAADRWHVIDRMAVSPASREQIKTVRTRREETAGQLIDLVGPICRVNVFYLDEPSAQVVWRAVDARPELTRASSLPCNVEITRAEAHKGAGLRWLCAHLGVDVADTVAFGDSDNDLTMLEAAGDGVAMGNANEACRAVADHTCPSCAESGVARYLRALWA